MSQTLGTYIDTKRLDMSSLVDSGIDTLREVLDPAALKSQLNTLPECSVSWGTVHDVSLRPLKWHKGRRCTLEVSFRTDIGPCQLIAKVYAKDRLDVHQAMDEMWRGQFGRSAQFSIPRPMAYVPSLRLHLEEKLIGKSIKEVFLAGEEKKQIEAAESAALWLAHFHQWAPHSGPPAAPSLEFTRMERWAGRFRELGGTLAANAQLLFERLAAAFSTLGQAELCAGHGSFSPDHVFLAGHRVLTIDWDGMDAGDPARDTARFVVAMHRLAVGRMGSADALHLPARSFLSAYTKIRGSAILPRLPYFRAATCLRLAKYGAFHHRVSRWDEKVAAMLLEGLRVLDA